MSIKDLFKKEKEGKPKVADKKKATEAQTKTAKDPVKPVVSDSNKTVATKVKTDSKTELQESVDSHRILVKPLNTEKGSQLAEQNKYIFMVHPKADKISIARAIQEVYKVKVSKVNIISYSGKNVRYGRISGKRKNWKKAIVTLPKGQTIEVYKGV